MAKKDKDLDRPLGVKLTAVLFILSGITIYLSAESIFLLVIILLFIALAVGLLYLRPWAKTTIMVVTVLGLFIYYPFEIYLNYSNNAGKWEEMGLYQMILFILLIIEIPISVAILWYLTRPKVISTFEKGEIVMAKKKIRILEENIEIGRHQCNEGKISKAELANLKADCHEEERRLRTKIRRLEKIRMNRERRLKERNKSKAEAKAEREEKKAEKRALIEEAEEEKRRAREREEKKKAKKKGKKTEKKGVEEKGKKAETKGIEEKDKKVAKKSKDKEKSKGGKGKKKSTKKGKEDSKKKKQNDEEAEETGKKAD